MTIGIYALVFKGTDKVYIGQSKCLESRAISHRHKMKKGIDSKKLNEAYNTFGEAEFTIITECELAELNSLEKEAILLYNSLDNGFNTRDESYGGNTTTKGELHHNSKVTNEDVVNVFQLLISTEYLSLKQISILTKVPYSIVCDISKCSNHRWLAAEFPEEYKILESLKHNRKSISRITGITYKVVSPEGVILEVHNISDFARKYGLNQTHLGNVLRGKAKSHKKWVLYKGDQS